MTAATAGSAFAQSESTSAATASSKPAAAKRVILRGDVLQVTRQCDPNGETPPQVFQYTVGDDGKLVYTNEVAGIFDAGPGLSFPFTVVGLTEAQIAEKISPSFGEGKVTVAVLVHVEKAEGAVGLMVNPQVVTLDLLTVTSLSDSTRFADKAVMAAHLDPNRCAVEVSPFLYPSDQVVGRNAASGASVSLKVVAKVRNGDREEAEALLRAACEEVASAFLVWGREAIRPLRDKMNLLEARKADYDRALATQQNELRRLLGDYASAAEYLKAVQRLSTDLEALKLTAVGEQARLERLQKMVDAARKKMEETAKADPLAAELEKIVDLRQQAMKNAEELARTGKSPESSVREALEKLAQARVDLLRRREEVARSAGGEQLAQLTQQLLATEMALADADVRSRAVEVKLMNMKLSPGEHPAEDKVKKIEEAQRQIEELSRGRVEYQKEADSLKRLLEVPPIQAAPALIPPSAPAKAPATKPVKPGK